MKKGILFVITAPSGCGKGSLRRLALAGDPNICFCPSLTTRAPRVGEVDGEDYFFVTKERFVAERDAGRLGEWALVYGNFYGTLTKHIEDCLSAGKDAVVEKDYQGARTLRQLYSNGVFIFILPPSLGELRKRIEGRGTEEEEQRNLRLHSATKEMTDLASYDYVIINSDLDRAKHRLQAIVAGERARHT